MEKSVLLTVDDEPQVLNAIERDLNTHYQGQYRIIKAGSGVEALELVQHLFERKTSIALFLVDQRMPGMTGTEFLVEARKRYPNARKVLLTAYADTQAAIESINRVGLDHYMLKPWHPPEQHLYPVLDAVLGEWMATHSYGGWTDDFLDGKRQMGDSLADKAAQELFENGAVQAVNELMKTLVRNDDLIPESLPPVIRYFLSQTDGLPAWADAEKIACGQRLFARNAPTIITILHCYSLPFSYAARKGARVLHGTSYMQHNPRRRIIETAQFLLDVMSPDGLTANGHGVRSAQKVRLMHAAIRLLIRHHLSWNPDDGVPINQEDMAGTLLAFSGITLEGLQQLGVRVTQDEFDAYLHLWNVVGHIMGVQYDLLPNNAVEAKSLGLAIKKRQWASSPEGQALTRALIDHLESLIPGTVFDGLASSLIRFYIGDEAANMLAVPSADWTKSLVRFLKFFTWAGNNVASQLPLLTKICELMGRRLIEGLLWCERGAERVPFYVPEMLRQTWELNLPLANDEVAHGSAG